MLVDGIKNTNTGLVSGLRTTAEAQPQSAQDLVSKAYVDAVAAGLDPKASVRLATVAPLGSLSGLIEVDGVMAQSGNRVLVKDEVDASKNGIYIAAAGPWYRTSDADELTLTPGSFTYVENGLENKGTMWVLTTTSFTVGQTALDFSPYGTGDIEWSAIRNRPSTAEGFGLTDVYTKAQVDMMISEARLDPYDIAVFLPSYTASTVVFDFFAPRELKIQQNFSSSKARASAAAAGSMVFTLQKNNLDIGTITFGVGVTTGVFSISSEITLAEGDKLTLVTPPSVDSTLAGISITIAALA